MSKQVRKNNSFQKNLQSNVDYSFVWLVVHNPPSKGLKYFNALTQMLHGDHP